MVVVVVVIMSLRARKVSVAYDLYRTGSLVLYLNPNVETGGSRFFCVVSTLAPAVHWSPCEDYKSPTGISIMAMKSQETPHQDKVLIPLRQRVSWMTM